MVSIYTKTYELEESQKKREVEHALGLALLKRGLKEEYAIDGTGLSIETGPHGKPYLSDYPRLFFNISHCDGLVACALADVPVGIDVERIKPVRPAVVRKVLSEREQAQLSENNGRAGEADFFRYWTLKESYVKAEGCGISLPLSGIEFLLPSECSWSCGPSLLSGGTYEFLQDRYEDYVLSLCFKSGTEVVYSQSCLPRWDGMDQAGLT